MPECVSEQSAKPQGFTFSLTAVGDGPDEAVRVRRMLKALARRHGLRVTWPISPDQNAPRRRKAAKAGT